MLISYFQHSAYSQRELCNSSAHLFGKFASKLFRVAINYLFSTDSGNSEKNILNDFAKGAHVLRSTSLRKTIVVHSCLLEVSKKNFWACSVSLYRLIFSPSAVSLKTISPLFAAPARFLPATERMRYCYNIRSIYQHWLPCLWQNIFV